MLNLTDKTKPELVRLGAELGIPLDGRMSEAGMREAINLHYSNQQAAGIIEEEKAKAAPVAADPVDPQYLTPEQVERACAAYFGSPHFVHSFLDDGKSYHFRARRNGNDGRGPWAEDTGTLAQPLGEIVKRAQLIARGPLVPAKLDENEFEAFDRGKYTGTVLATR